MRNFAILFFTLLFTGWCFSARCQNVLTKPVLELEETKKYKKENKIPNYLNRNFYYNDIRGLKDAGAPKNYGAYREKVLHVERKKAKSELSTTSRQNTGAWGSMGPDSFENYTSIGRVNRIDFHPVNPDIIYAATAGGGLWVTFNHGAQWSTLSEHIPNMNLSGIAVHNDDLNTLYILTGDADGCCGGAKTYDLRKFSTGVLKSEDQGYTWDLTGLNFDENDEVRAYNIIMHPVNSDTLFVSTDQGIYKTTDGFETWERPWTGMIYEVKFKPNNPNVMYAVDDFSFIKSIDGGDTWTTTQFIPEFFGERDRITMATCENEPNRVYLYAAPRHDSLTLHRGLFLSEDSGNTFTKVDSTANLSGAEQGYYDLAVACSGADGEQVIVGKVSISKSADSGSTFVESTGLHADQHQFNINPLLPDRVYAANDGGIYYSDSFGDPDSWVYISEGMSITQYYKISVSQLNQYMVAGGSQDNGSHINYNFDEEYVLALSKDGMDCAIHPTTDSLVILSAQNGEFHISSNGGVDMTPLFNKNDLEEGAQDAWVTPVAWDPTDVNNIYLGYKPIYRSFDLGISMNEISDSVGGRRFLHVGTENPNIIYASDCYNNAEGGCEYHIHKSENQGDTWETIHNTLDSTLLQSKKSGVTTNPNDSDEVWITIAGFIDGKKVYRSIDGGDNWTNESGSLPNIPINCIIQENTGGSPSGAVYIGTDVGVYYRNDDLGDWLYFSNLLPSVEVADIDIHQNTGHVYVGTHGMGIWRSLPYSDCGQNAYLNSTTIPSNHDLTYQVQDTIFLSDYTIESFGANMKLKAENIILIENFVAKSDNGNLFKARLGPCGGGVETLQEEEEEVVKN